MSCFNKHLFMDLLSVFLPLKENNQNAESDEDDRATEQHLFFRREHEGIREKVKQYSLMNTNSCSDNSIVHRKTVI